MSKRFATGFERPAVSEGYPLTLSIAVSPAVVQPLYFERVYLDAAGTQLAIRATLINGRGWLWLTDFGPFPAGTRRIEASITNQNRPTEADPVLATPEAQTSLPRFATPLEMPRLFGDHPLHLAMGIGATRQTVYLERVYKGYNGQELAIRSDVVYDRNMLVGFNIHLPEPPAGTKSIEVCLTNQYRATELTDTLEYNVLEFNELEYN